MRTLRWILPTLRSPRRLDFARPNAESVRTLYATIPARPGNDAVDIFYEGAGLGRHPVLLLPGALGSTRTDFGAQLDQLRDDPDLQLVAWDPRGYGKSRPPSRSVPADFFVRDADDAVALMTSLNLTPFTMWGWSDGGITAMIAAARHPDAIDRMVIWGCNAYVSDYDVNMFESIRDISKWSERMRKPLIDLYGEPYFRQTWEDWVDWFKSVYTEKDGDLCKELLKDIRCPTLIVHGDKDPMVDPQHPVFLRNNIADSKLIRWPEAKHNLHLRYAPEFNRTARDFTLGVTTTQS